MVLFQFCKYIYSFFFVTWWRAGSSNHLQVCVCFSVSMSMHKCVCVPQRSCWKKAGHIVIHCGCNMKRHTNTSKRAMRVQFLFQHSVTLWNNSISHTRVYAHTHTTALFWLRWKLQMNCSHTYTTQSVRLVNASRHTHIFQTHVQCTYTNTHTHSPHNRPFQHRDHS